MRGATGSEQFGDGLSGGMSRGNWVMALAANFVSGPGPVRRALWSAVAAGCVLLLTGLLIGSLLNTLSWASRNAQLADQAVSFSDDLHQLSAELARLDATRLRAEAAEPGGRTELATQAGRLRLLLDRLTPELRGVRDPGPQLLGLLQSRLRAADLIATDGLPAIPVPETERAAERNIVLGMISDISATQRAQLNALEDAQHNWRQGLYIRAFSIAGVSALLLALAISIGLRHFARQEATDLALRRARDAAVAANRAKSRFLAAASHDLRQPLHALNLFASALDRRVTDAEGRSFLEGLRSASSSMERMFHSLLDMSKLDAGVVRPEAVDFPLFDLLESIRTEFSAVAAERKLNFQVATGGEIVHTDPALLESVLRNLISNAIRYTHHGTVQVTCRRMHERAIVEVRDTGPGIPADKLETIFEEFQRLEGSAHVTQGLGLGLAIVRRTCNLLGLEVGVRSVVGAGSTFSLAIPVGKAAKPRALREVEEDDPAILIGLTVLVVDDDEMVLRAIAQELRDWGLNVLAASSPAEVITALDDRTTPRPDLAVVDRNLSSTMTGPELLDHLAVRFQIAIPAIVLNGETSAEVLEELRETGYPYLIKTVDPKALRSALTALATNRPLAQALSGE